MTTESLSQQEIDLLFSGGSAPTAVKLPPRERRLEVQVYDFRRPNLVSKDRMRALEAMYGVLAKSLEGWMTAKVRGQAEVTLMAVEQLSFGEFMLSLPNPCSSYVYDIGDTSQQAVIDFGQDLAFFYVDRLAGSSGAPAVQQRGLTPLERMIVRLIADRVSEQLQEIWQDHVGLALTLSRFESVPDMLQTSGREEPVLVTHLDVAAAGIRSPLMVCLPFAVLERFFTQGTGAHVRSVRTRRTELEVRAAESLVRSVGVDITARFPAFQVPLRTLHQLRVGSTLTTPLPHDVPLTVWAEQTVLGQARPGRAGGKLSICLTAIQPEFGPTTTRRVRVSPLPSNGGAALNLGELGAGTASGESAPLASLLHLVLPVTIELGRTRMTVQEILELGRGSVIQLDRLVGEPVDVLVGGRVFAEGEVVVIGEQFGVRITKLAHTGESGQA